MDFDEIGARIAASPRRRSVLTTRSNMDSDASGAPRFRPAEELSEHLEKSALNAVLVEDGDRGWVAVYSDKSGSGFAVARVPTGTEGNLLTTKVKSASEAIEAAMMV